jgi:hypothetical protein
LLLGAADERLLMLRGEISPEVLFVLPGLKIGLAASGLAGGVAPADG